VGRWFPVVLEQNDVQNRSAVGYMIARRVNRITHAHVPFVSSFTEEFLARRWNKKSVENGTKQQYEEYETDG
jgi:hypothetical protein